MATATEISLSELSLKEKVAQMVIVKGDKFDHRYLDLGVGGIFLNSQKTKQGYVDRINQYQENSKIKLFVSTDMEGYWNPFSFYKGKTFGEIENPDQARALAEEQAKLLEEIGFNLDFSPIVESENTVWPGRTFKGTREEISDKSRSYVKGLQENGILATAKHYPGGSMVRNPHFFRFKTDISKEELSLFDQSVKDGVSTVMVGHPIVKGAIDSKGRQSTVSPEVISHLRKNFDGVIITDDIGMFGLKWSYFLRERRMYIDLVKAGNDVILDSGFNIPSASPKRTKKMINTISQAVENGQIPEEQIDASVTRILKAKGYVVKT